MEVSWFVYVHCTHVEGCITEYVFLLVLIRMELRGVCEGSWLLIAV